MNIFYLSHHQGQCARWHCDKHVVKMILEYTQILYTVFYLTESKEQLASSPWNKNTGRHGYLPVHNKKHPSVVWAAEALPHYVWLTLLAKYLVKEYHHRYQPKKPHACEEHIQWLSKHLPEGLLLPHKLVWLRPPPPAMPEEYKVEHDSIQSYINYYNGSKAERGLLVYTRRSKPHILL